MYIIDTIGPWTSPFKEQFLKKIILTASFELVIFSFTDALVRRMMIWEISVDTEITAQYYCLLWQQQCWGVYHNIDNSLCWPGSWSSLFQIFDGRMEGLKSLNRSSDAILSYSEDTGSPIFTIDTSLMLSNLTFKSGAKGQVANDQVALSFVLTFDFSHWIWRICLLACKVQGGFCLQSLTCFEPNYICRWVVLGLSWPCPT